MRNFSSRITNYFHTGGARNAIVAVFLASVFILASCGGTPVSSSHSKKGGTLQVGLTADPVTLDPLINSSSIDRNIYDSLVRYDANDKIQPDLASSYWYTSPTTLNLRLRTGIQFQDGTPFNADAVLFNLNRYRNYKAGPWYGDVSSIKDVVKVSDSQVQIQFKYPFAPILDLLARSWATGAMLSPTAIKKLGRNLGNAPVNAGTGPFSFVEWVKGDHLLLKANPHYWQKDANGIQLPYLQSIQFRIITNTSVMYTNLKTNQIQVAQTIDPNDVADAQSNPNIIYKWTTALGWYDIHLNETAPPLNNVHVRRAIAYAINRQELLTTIYKGVGSVATGPLTSATWAYDKSYPGIGYDLKQAKAELAQAGMSSVKINLLVTSGDPTTTQEAELIQSQLQAANITVNIQQETSAATYADEHAGHYQSLLTSYGSGIADPDSPVDAPFASTSTRNYEHYANPQVDSLLQQARTTLAQSQRIPLYRQAQKLIVQDAAVVFLINEVTQQITTSQVKNYAISPITSFYFGTTYLA